MEIERNKNGSKAPAVIAKSKTPSGEVPKQILNSENADKVRAPQVDVPSIRLSPEQIEEIHADEYSLTLFYATRVEPLTINDLKREFPEPEPKKAQSVMERFLKVGLVQVSPEGFYYSNYPDNYINYSHYRYDGDLEARKDSKVFQLMKEFTGKPDYWKDKTYFSMDAFYSKEQTDELLEMFKAIKLKSKEFANKNAEKKSIRGLKFRRMKFFDMTFVFLFAILLSLGISSKSYAGGNDPVVRLLKYNPTAALNLLTTARFVGGGNDPTAAAVRFNDPSVYLAYADVPIKNPGNDGGGGHDPSTKKDPSGGGGHDPVNPVNPNPSPDTSCVLEFNGKMISVSSARVCKLKKLIDFISWCGDSDHPSCVEAEKQTDLLIQKIQIEMPAK